MAGVRPSQAAQEIAAVLDDNLDVPIGEVVRFELALADNPADAATRQVYRDWLLDHGCTRRAEQLAAELSREPAVYKGPVRPDSPADNWAGL